MRAFIFISLFFCLSICSYGQSQIDSYLKIAAKNNPELKTAFNEYMAALEKLPQAKTLPDPILTFAYFIEPVETRMGPQEFKIGLSQMFPWFGTLKNKNKAATEMAKAKYEYFLDIKSEVFNNVKHSYYDLYFNYKSIIIMQENISLLKLMQKLALIKVEAGLVSAADEYRIEMEINDLDNSLSLLNDNKIVLNTTFKNVLNIDDSEEINYPTSLDDNNIIESQTSIMDSIKQRNHKLLSTDLQIKELEYKLTLAKKMGMPSFNIGLEYISVGTGEMKLPGDDAFVFPKIGLSLPIYRSKYSAMKREALHKEEAKREQRNSITNMLENNLEKTWRDYNDALNKIKLYEEQISISKKTLDILEISYASNNSNFEDYIQTQRRMLMYSLALEKAIINKHRAIASIEYLKGN